MSGATRPRERHKPPLRDERHRPQTPPLPLCSMPIEPPPPRIFLLSPAHCGGRRAELLLGGGGRFALALQLHEGGTIPLGEAFTFLSGLYFRGKLAYARRFARPPAGVPGVQVITTNRGLLPADTPSHDATSCGPSRGRDIRAGEPRYRSRCGGTSRRSTGGEPREHRRRSFCWAASRPASTWTCCSTSWASGSSFRRSSWAAGDMSRGALLLRAARADEELAYAPVRRPTVRRGRGRERRDRRWRRQHTSAVRGADVRPEAERAPTLRPRAPKRFRSPTSTRSSGPRPGLTKRDLLQYYADVSRALLPHLVDRAMVMKRYPNGIHGKCFFMKRTPLAAPRVARDLRDRAQVGERDRLSDGPGPRLAALGGEPRLHRPQPVVCPLRRHRPAGLSALRSRSRAGRAVRARARDGARRARRARVARHDAAGEDERLDAACTSTCRSCAGPLQKEVWQFAKALAQGARAPASRS